MSPFSRKTVQAGFTLIELLVVVAIIGLLAAILFPVFGRVREKARQSACQSNLKQLGLAFMQYSQDYDERMPQGTDTMASCPDTTDETAFVGGGWAGQIYPYVKSKPLFRCLDDPLNSKPSSTLPDVISYIYNSAIPAAPSGNICSGSASNTKVNGLGGGANCRLSVFNSPAQTVLLTENTSVIANLDTPGETDSTSGNGTYVGSSRQGSGRGRSNYPMFTTGVIDNCASPATADTCTSWNFWGGANVVGVSALPGLHSEGANFLAADGHVKWLKGMSVSGGWAAVKPTNAQTQGASNPRENVQAEGTQYTGGNKHQMTFSPF